MTDNELNNEKDMRDFLKSKYNKEIIFFSLIAICIFIFRWFEFLDNAATGALLGSLIGFFVSEIRKIHS